MKKFCFKWIFIISMLMIFTGNVYASSVFFQIVQQDNTSIGERNSSYLIEDTFFDYYFDKGIIMSNSDIMFSQNEKDNDSALSEGLKNSKECNFDYLIQIVCTFDETQSEEGAELAISNIKGISWKIVNVKSGKVISNGKEEIIFKEKDNKNAKNTLISYSKKIADSIYKSIN